MQQATTLQLSWMDAVCTPLVALRGSTVLRANRYLEDLFPGCFQPGSAFIADVAVDQQKHVAEFLNNADIDAVLVCRLDIPGRKIRVRISCSPLQDIGDDICLVTLTPLDPTDDQERQYSVRVGLLKSLIHQLLLNVFAIDRDGIIIFEDSHLTSVQGMPTDHVGKSVYDVHAQEEEFLEDTRRVLAGETVERERTYEGCVYETYYAPIHDAHGAIIGAVVMDSDITERLRMQQTAIEAGRLRITLQKEVEVSEMKSKIMRRISHEFRTPLSTIQLSAQMLERYNDRLSSAEREKRIEHIIRETRHITRLLDDIALVVKSQSQTALLTISEIDLAALCQSLIEELRTASAEQHNYAVSVAPEAERVCVDTRLVGIMLQNLLSNAAKYSEPGMVIKLQAFREGDQLVLRVSDHGIGILPEEQEHVFEVFYRGSNFDERPGLGLGLSLVHDAVAQHNGSIHLDSTPGVGTTVTIRLPL